MKPILNLSSGVDGYKPAPPESERKHPLAWAVARNDVRDIITINAPLDAESLVKFLQTAIEITSKKYPTDQGWSKAIVEQRKEGWAVYVYLQTIEVKKDVQ